ncbi:MAG: hypothetical protein ACE15E_04500 [Acidobacteriota bacterium]
MPKRLSAESDRTIRLGASPGPADYAIEDLGDFVFPQILKAGLNRGQVSRTVGTILIAALFVSSSLYAARLTARVFNSDGSRAASIRIHITNLDTGKTYDVVTDAAGGFEIDLPGGDFFVAPDGAVSEDHHVLRVAMQPDVDKNLDLDLIRDLAHGWTRLAPRQPAETAESVGTEPGSDAGLAVVCDYDTILSRATGAGPAPKVPLEDLINPFGASRRGAFHGSLYEFHRNDNLDARNFFDPVGEPLPEYKRNQFGLNLSTSLSPQLQLMGSYDGLRIVQGSTLLSHVPTRAMKAGDFRELPATNNPIVLKDPLTGEPWPGNRIPPGRIDSISAKLLELLPDPNRPDPDRNFVNNEPLVNDQDTITLKFDCQYAGAKISSDYHFNDSETERPQPLPSFGATESSRGQDFRLGLSYSFTNRLMADLRFSFIRSLAERYSRNAGRTGLLASTGIAGLTVSDPLDEGYPQFWLSGYTSFGDQSSPVTSVFNGFFTDASVTYALDTHTVRAGTSFDFRQYNNYRSGGSHRGAFSFNGLYSGDAFADFLFGLPETASRAAGDDRSDIRGSNWQFFVRDSWKLSPRLTVSQGLTYGYFPPYRSMRANVSGFYPLIMEPPRSGELIIAGSEPARRIGLPDSSLSLVHGDKNNFAPSLGFAYNPLGSSRLVIRASYSVGFESMGPGYFISYLGHNFPFYYVETVQSSITAPSVQLADPFSAALPVEQSIRGIDPYLRNPYYQDWQLGIEGELLQNWRLEASYRGDKGTRLIRVLPANVPLPGREELQSRRPNPAFGRFTVATNSGSYSNNAFVLGGERRFSRGISAETGFTWNRTFSDSFPGSPNNVRKLRAERSPVGYQPNRRFWLRYILDLSSGTGRFLGGDSRNSWLKAFVSGWRLTGITSIQDGVPFTVYTAGDLNNDGLTGERPDRIGSGRLPADQRSIDRWFATEAFVDPAPFSFGNSGQSILSGPGYINWDVSIIKQTRFAHGKQVELRVELFNAFNHANFGQPEAVLGNSTFGKIFAAARAREIEVAIKCLF